MRVLFVHYGGPKLAGSEIALLELLGGLRRKGIVPLLWCNALVMEQAAREMDIPVWRDEFTHYLDYSSPPFSLSGYRRLVKKGMARIAESGAEIVVCNSAAPAQWMSLACRRKAVPWLIYMHSRYLKRSRYVLGMHLADAIVAVTAAIAKPLLIDGMAPDRISVIHNGFDEAKLLQGRAENLRAELSIPPDSVVGAMAGSLLRLKGHDILFEAMRLLPEPPPILVIGDGPERKTLETLAAGLPVHFLGHRAELGAILRDAADFLVAPSRQEAFGRVIIEAAFAGIPAIGADIEGIPEAISDDVTGLLVPPESPKALAGAISHLIADQNLRTRLGQAARQRAKAQFSIEKVAAAMAETLARTARRRTKVSRLRPYTNLLFGRSAP
jgi:hypothetical protein